MSKTITSLWPVALLEEQQGVGGCLWERKGPTRDVVQKVDGLATGLQAQPWVAPKMGTPRRANTASWSGRGTVTPTEETVCKSEGQSGDDQHRQRPGPNPSRGHTAGSVARSPRHRTAAWSQEEAKATLGWSLLPGENGGRYKELSRVGSEEDSVWLVDNLTSSVGITVWDRNVMSLRK